MIRWERRMRFIRKFFAGIIFTFLTGLFLPFLITFLVLQTYVSPDFLKETFLAESYAKLDLAFEQVELPQGQDKEMWIRNLKKILPKERYVLLGDAFIGALFDGFKGFKPGSPLKISLEGPKKEAISEIKKISSQMAPCAAGEDAEKDLCIPPEYPPAAQKRFQEEIARQFGDELQARIPSNFTLQENKKFPWLKYASGLLRYRSAIVWGMAGTILIFLLLADLLLWRPVYRFFRWNASVFLLFSLESFSLFILFTKVPELLLKVPSVKPATIDIIKWLLSYFVWYTVASGILFGILCAASFVISFLLPNEHPKKV